MLLENNIDSVQNDLDEMQPRDRVNALLQFMKFVIPTQKAIELENRELPRMKQATNEVSEDLPLFVSKFKKKK